MDQILEIAWIENVMYNMLGEASLMKTKRHYKPRTYAPLPQSFFDSRNAISDELNRIIEERVLLQQEAADLAGVTQSRMSKLQNKRFTRSDNPEVEAVTAWSMLEALMALGANLRVSVGSYSTPGKGSIEFMPVEKSWEK